MTQPILIANRYKVLDSLGEGGFAHVYRAMDQEMGRTVAVKILKLELLGYETMRQTFLERFAREVSITASLEHPHLVPVYDTGMTQDEHGHERPYLVMKLLEGQDLESTLEHSGPLSVEQVLKIGEQALDALAYVHEKGIVHKDLKPANLFLSHDHRGEPHLYVMDFGIAHDPRGGGGRMTQTGAFTGTLQYLAPEYLLDQIAAPCVDVYQMGLILVELLCNRPLVSHETTMPELIAKYIRRDPIMLPGSLKDMAAGKVFACATNFDHNLRYQDAGEFLEAWESLGEEDFPEVIGEFSAQDTISERETSGALLLAPPEVATDVVSAVAPTLSGSEAAISELAFAPTVNGELSAVVPRASTRKLWAVAGCLIVLILGSAAAAVALYSKPVDASPSLTGAPAVMSEPARDGELVASEPSGVDAIVEGAIVEGAIVEGAIVEDAGRGVVPLPVNTSPPVEPLPALEGRREQADGTPPELVKAPLDEKKRPDPKARPIKVKPVEAEPAKSEPVEVKDEGPTTTLPPEF